MCRRLAVDGSNPSQRRGLRAAASVILGTLVGAGTNVLTGDWNWAVGVAVGVAILVWAALEWHRAVDENRGSQVGAIHVIQKLRRVAGQLTGVRRSRGGGEVRVWQ